MQMCHSVRCKQIDMSMVNQLISSFPNSAERPILLFFKRGLINCLNVYQFSKQIKLYLFSEQLENS